MKLYIDYSSLTLWRLCPQKFIFNSKLNIQGGATDALNFGTLIHLGTELFGVASQNPSFELPTKEAAYQEIEALAVAKQVPDVRLVTNPLLKVLNQVAEEASQYALSNLDSDEKRSLKHALTLIAEYTFHYHPDALPYRGFEHKFEIFLGKTAAGHEVFYRGTIAGLLVDGVLERKTSYDLTAFLGLLTPNYQAVGYVWAAREITGNNKISKVIFDGISTKGFGKSKGSAYSNQDRWTIYNAPETLFLRAQTVVTDSQIEDWKTQTIKDADRLLEDWKAEKVTRNAPSACNAYNTNCAYKAICMSGSKSVEQTLINGMPKQKDIWDGF